MPCLSSRLFAIGSQRSRPFTLEHVNSFIADGEQAQLSKKKQEAATQCEVYFETKSGRKINAMPGALMSGALMSGAQILTREEKLCEYCLTMGDMGIEGRRYQESSLCNSQ